MKRHVERSMKRMGESVTAKMGLIVILILLFLIPLGMIRSLVTERETRRNNAVEEAGARVGGRVVTGGPILTVPYLVKHEREEGKPVTLRRFVHVFPALLEISGDVEPAERRRGIYRIPLYNATLRVRATFGPLEANEPDLSSALGIVDTLVNEAREKGFSDQQIVFGGFSQGACLASEYVARNATKYAAEPTQNKMRLPKLQNSA